MVKFAALFTALVATVASAAVIAPKPAASNETEIVKRDFYGSGTYYEVGLGACGISNNDGQAVVAVSASYFDSYPGATANPNNNPLCGKQVWVWAWTGYSPQLATIVDRCTGCAEYDIDMSPTLFQNTVGALSIGRAPIGWNWA